jgi:hypothetical protein
MHATCPTAGVFIEYRVCISLCIHRGGHHQLIYVDEPTPTGQMPLLFILNVVFHVLVWIMFMFLFFFNVNMDVMKCFEGHEKVSNMEEAIFSYQSHSTPRHVAAAG